HWTKATELLANSPIRTKLWVLMGGMSSLALFLAGVGLFVFERYEQRVTVQRELWMRAEIVGGSSTAALSFDDRRAAREILASEREDGQLAQAVIFDREKRIFAQYQRGNVLKPAAVTVRPDGAYFENGELVVFQPITLEGERIGTIYLRSTLQ